MKKFKVLITAPIYNVYIDILIAEAFSAEMLVLVAINKFVV